MNKFINIFSHSNSHTTARYFYSVIQNSKVNVRYWSETPDFSQIGDDDIFFFIDPCSDWPIGLEKIRCLKIAYLIDVHQDLKLRIFQSKFFNKVYIAQYDYVNSFNDFSIQDVSWLPLACSPNLYSSSKFLRSIDLSFVGNFGSKGSYRFEILNKIKDIFPGYIIGTFVPPRDMVNIYQKSKIVFNISVNNDLNMRFFEAMASGALVITDRINNGLDSLFMENIHYVAYSSLDDAINKINYYLIHEKERLTIANNGFLLVHKMHTYEHRWKKILNDISLSSDNYAQITSFNKSELSLIYSEIFFRLRKPIRSIISLARYGFTFYGSYLLFLTYCRKFNQFIPITPKAIAFRIKHIKSR